MKLDSNYDWVLIPESHLDRLVIRSLIAAKLDSESEKDAWGYAKVRIDSELADDGSLPTTLVAQLPEDTDVMELLTRSRSVRVDARLTLFSNTYSPETSFSWETASLTIQLRFTGENWTTDLRRFRAEFAEDTKLA